jgi:hypothetical protein
MVRAFFSVVLAVLLAASIAQDCALVVPAAPLSAQGLATAYILKSADPAKPPCVMSVAEQQAFVEALIFDPATSSISVYHPLVVTDGVGQEIAPLLPVLPLNAIVGIWFGTNSQTITLLADKKTGRSLIDGQCVNGLPGSVFGQFAHCNAPTFFDVVNAFLEVGPLSPPIPPLGTSNVDRKPCMTSRDFALVDQDPSDNVVTKYLITAKGTTAVLNAKNKAALPAATVIKNGSDEGLLVVMNAAMGCTPYMAPDLSDSAKALSPALGLNELHAAAVQRPPIALIARSDPMTRGLDGMPSLDKINLYRRAVNQDVAADLGRVSSLFFCFYFAKTAPPRLTGLQAAFSATASPFPEVGSNLYTFLAARFSAAYGIMQCEALLDMPVPVALTLNADGVATDANFNLAAARLLRRDVDTYNELE